MFDWSLHSRHRVKNNSQHLVTRVLLLTVVDTEKFNHTKEKNLKGNVATQILGTDSQDRVLSYLDFGGGG